MGHLFPKVRYFNVMPMYYNMPKEMPAGVTWTQATFDAGIAEWRCPCGKGGYGLSLWWARLRLAAHLLRGHARLP